MDNNKKSISSTKRSSALSQSLLGLILSALWSFLLFYFLAFESSLNATNGVLIYIVFNTIISTLVALFTRYKIFALVFFITGIVLSTIVQGLISSIRWL